MGKGENAGNQHFLLFPQGFLPFPKQILILQSHLDLFCRLQILSISTRLKFRHLVELSPSITEPSSNVCKRKSLGLTKERKRKKRLDLSNSKAFAVNMTVD